ncbi:hypothetical protein JR064_11330 [Xanthomonas sp. CFBP 8703]|uniref:BACK domain-containing protein n=1 Tax=Xanthomonas bonasiae TaxID=2810351 RepID=A0ABS3B593_9XANT|nr:hypothetical protein [Xanthomonas bonasiae]MBN6102760.1 hypothetical protein [Xanthomonas bonasiae]
MPINKNDCRGDANKARIVREYTLLAIGRFAIAPGATIEGCCGELSDEQIVFTYTSNTRPTDAGQFSVGKDCAEQFLQRIGQVMPEAFTPFAAPQGAPSPGTGSSSSAAGLSAASIDPLNKEVYRAILLWCSLKQQIPQYSTARILEQIARDPAKKIEDKQVYELFKVIATYRKSLAELVQAASSSHKLKALSFPLLDAMASKNWIGLP